MLQKARLWDAETPSPSTAKRRWRHRHLVAGLYCSCAAFSRGGQSSTRGQKGGGHYYTCKKYLILCIGWPCFGSPLLLYIHYTVYYNIVEIYCKIRNIRAKTRLYLAAHGRCSKYKTCTTWYNAFKNFALTGRCWLQNLILRHIYKINFTFFEQFRPRLTSVCKKS